MDVFAWPAEEDDALHKATMRFVSPILVGRHLLLEVPCQAFGHRPISK